MIAKCIDNDNTVDLTIGKTYKILGFDNAYGWIRIKGDEGEVFWYAPIYFEVWE